MNDRTKAALIGGVVAGVLSGLPVVSGCCFLWAIGGGFLAVFMYLKNAPTQLMTADGAKLGATAGVIAAVISLLLGVPFMLLGVGSAAMQNADLERAGVSAGILAVGGFVGLILRALVVVGFAVLGGVIGVAVLGKNRPGGGSTNVPPPPPPPNYGGGTQPPAGGGYGAGGGGGYTGGGGSSFGAGS
ncbi:MAG TPA: hypothetical protein VF656_00325 [Pyrinomonadaceae bacterium]|jgi:hypothetical protein